MSSSLAVSPHLVGLAEPLAYHYPDRWGYVAVCTQQGSDPWAQRCVKLAALPKYLEDLDRKQNVWVSQSEFNKRNRRVVNLERLTVLYLDLDIHKVDGYRDASPEQQVGALLLACEDQSIPPPSLAVHSGRGLQVKWLLEKPVPQAALPRWKALQSELFQRLRHLGADPNALDASRVLRLVGSINSRNFAAVHVAYINDCPTMGGGRRADGLVAFDFELLARELLPVDRRELEERRDQLAGDFVLRDCLQAANENWRPAQPVPVQDDRSSARASAYPNLRRLPATQLGWDRLRDLRHIVKMRGMEAGAPSGHRNVLVFLGACFLAQSAVAWRFWDEVRELAREFAPTWTEQQVLGCLQTIKGRTEAALRGERLDWSGVSVDPRYRFTNAKLIDALEITPAEERELRTIISVTERKRRGAERAAQRRRAAGAPTLVDVLASRSDMRVSARLLRAQGLSFPAIARELGIGLGSAYNYCKDAE